MPELTQQVRDLVDGSCPPVTLEEISARCGVLSEQLPARMEPRWQPRPRASYLTAASIAALVLAVSALSAWIVQPRGQARSHHSISAAGKNAPSEGRAVKPSTARALPASVAHFMVGTGTPPGLWDANCGSATCFVSSSSGIDGNNTSGSMYVSHDAGRTWAPTVLPAGTAMATPVSCVNDAWCAGGAGRRDVATGDPAAGKVMSDPELLVTTDGGASWSAHALPIPPDVQQLPASHGLPAETTYWPATVDAVACTDVGVCNVIAHVQNNINPDGGLLADTTIFLRTTDGGGNWAQTTLPRNAAERHDETSGYNGSSAGLACPTATTCIAVVTYMSSIAGPQDVVAWRTDDNGATWRESHLPGLDHVWPGLSCPTPDECWAVTDGALLHTLDGGATWSHVAPPLAANPHDLPVTFWFSMSCVSSDACFASGAQGIAVTTDRGTTWMRLSLPDGIKDVDSISCELDGFCVALANPPDKPTIGGQGSALVLTNGPA